MRLSDYMGLEVVDRDGRQLGRVHDARLVADGPPDGPFGPALRLHGFLVGRGSLGARLGLDRPQMRGPWLLKRIFHRQVFREIRWDEVDHVDDDRMYLSTSDPSPR
jgi:hypothetical protein